MASHFRLFIFSYDLRVLRMRLVHDLDIVRQDGKAHRNTYLRRIHTLDHPLVISRLDLDLIDLSLIHI